MGRKNRKKHAPLRSAKVIVMLSPRKVAQQSELASFMTTILNENTAGEETFNFFECYQRIFKSGYEIPHIQEFCISVLLNPEHSVASKVFQITEILLHFEIHSTPVESTRPPLIDMLFGPVLDDLSRRMSSKATTPPAPIQQHLDAVLDLIYSLCSTPNEKGFENLAVALRWVESCAESRSFKITGRTGNCRSEVELNYLRTVSAALWSVAAGGGGNISKEIGKIVAATFLRKLCNWHMKSRQVGWSKNLKSVLAGIVSSVCYDRPWLFVYLMYSLDLLVIMGEAYYDKVHRELNGFEISDLIQEWYFQGILWEKLEPNRKFAERFTRKAELNNVFCMVFTSAKASETGNLLKELGLLQFFGSTISEFCRKYDVVEAVNQETSSSICTALITETQLYHILHFSYLMCLSVHDFRCWCGTSDGSQLWLPILNLLCSPSSYSCFGTQLKCIEGKMCRFLSAFCLFNPVNQKIVACFLKETILKNEILSPFCRELMVKLLLEDEEEVYVHVKSEMKFREIFQWSPLIPDYDYELPPWLGSKERNCLFDLPSNVTVEDILEMIEVSGYSLRLESIPDVSIPPETSMRSLMAAEMNILKGRSQRCHACDIQLTLCKETEQERDSNTKASLAKAFLHCPPIPSLLETFIRLGGFRLLLERFKHRKGMPISRNSIECFLHNLDHLPGFLDALLEDQFRDRLNCFLRLLIGTTVDKNGRQIGRLCISRSLRYLPFDVLEKVVGRSLPRDKDKPITKSILKKRKLTERVKFSESLEIHVFTPENPDEYNLIECINGC